MKEFPRRLPNLWATHFGCNGVLWRAYKSARIIFMPFSSSHFVHIIFLMSTVAHYIGHLFRCSNITIPSSAASITMYYHLLMLNGLIRNSQNPQTDHNQDIKIKTTFFHITELRSHNLTSMPPTHKWMNVFSGVLLPDRRKKSFSIFSST